MVSPNHEWLGGALQPASPPTVTHVIVPLRWGHWVADEGAGM